MQNSVIAASVAAVTPDAASLTAVVAGIPVVIAQTEYSREFEAEAEEYAFKLLKRKGFSPEAFASVMERLEEKRGKQNRPYAYTSTHPITAERVARRLAFVIPKRY